MFGTTKKPFFLFLIFILLLSCQEKVQKKTSFYHWKLNIEDVTSSELLQRINPQSIYLHIMDIDLGSDNKKLYPIAHIRIKKDDGILSQNIIPVVFIHNRVMAGSDSLQLKELAQKILDNRKSFYTHFNIQYDSKELQIDCDWLRSHKDKYFYFLKVLKELCPDITLSVTLRLYPYKYRQTMGIPPVDYATLMCYNMDDIKKLNIRQSILNPDILAQYLTNKNYPLKIKVALPVFGWWAWFNNDNYKNIFYFTDDFKNNVFLKKTSEFKYRLLIDTSINGHYLRKGDILRNEFPTIEDLKESIQTLESNLDFDEIIYYHWDNQLIQKYEKAFIQ